MNAMFFDGRFGNVGHVMGKTGGGMRELMDDGYLETVSRNGYPCVVLSDRERKKLLSDE